MFFYFMILPAPKSTLFPYTTLFRSFKQYRLGYFGPGKLEGSLLNWVNGALLKEVAERSGYDVHFAPFHYRKESKSRSEEHTSELQSQFHIVCRLLLEKKKK